MEKNLKHPCQWTLSFFDPDIKCENGLPYKYNQYIEILKEQVYISYKAKGISIADTDEMCPYDRKLIRDTLLEIQEKENESLQKLLSQK